MILAVRKKVLALIHIEVAQLLDVCEEEGTCIDTYDLPANVGLYTFPPGWGLHTPQGPSGHWRSLQPCFIRGKDKIKS